MRYRDQSTKLIPKKSINRVIILGAGVAGVRAALTVEELSHKGELEIIVIDEKYYHLLIPNLHEAATAKISTDSIRIPLEQLFRGKDITFHHAKVSEIDLKQKFVIASGMKIPYDQLVISLGGRTNFYNIHNLREWAFPLRSLEDAESIRTHVLEMFELAVQERDIKRKKSLLTFVVGGVGAAGTQLVTELADWIRDLTVRFGISQNDIRIVAVEAMDTMGIDSSLVRYANNMLKKKGIKLILGAAILSIDKHTLVLSNDKRIQTHTLVWTGGLRGNELIESSGLRVNHQGRARVNNFLEAERYKGVYVIGDASIVIDPETGKSMIPSAQMAINEATYVAGHLIARIRNLQKQEYKPHRRGVAISLGRKDGASIIGKIRLLGKLGKYFKTLTEIRYLYLLGGLQQVVERLRLRSKEVMQV